MSPVRPDTLPRASSLWSLHRPGDFLDCYSVESRLTLKAAVQRGFAFPQWVTALLALRNLLARSIGLKEGGDPRVPRLGIFPILKDDGQELVLGLDDWHLDFRIGFIRDGTRVYMSTWVNPHNWFGRAYLRLVMPFHILISRGAVARMATGR